MATVFLETVKKGEADSSTSEIFVVESLSKRFKFSNKFKHSKITISEDNVVKMPDQYVSYNYFVLC